MTFNNLDRRICFFLVAGAGRHAMIALGCRTESGFTGSFVIAYRTFNKSDFR